VLSLSLAAKKVTKESRRNSDGSNFGGGTIERWCYCGAGLIDSDNFSFADYCLATRMTMRVGV